MKLPTIFFASAMLLTGAAHAMTDALPSLSQCLKNATTSHGRELCQRLDNCQTNHSDTNQELRDCILKANTWHGAAHKDYLITVSTGGTKKKLTNKRVKAKTEVSGPTKVEIDIHEDGGRSNDSASNSLLDPANSNADWVADMTGSRGRLMGPN